MFILPKVQGLVKLGLGFFLGFFFCFCFFWQWGEMDFNWKRGRKFSFLMEHMFFFVQSNSGVFCFPDTWNLHAPKVYRGKAAGSNGGYIVLQTLQTRRVPRKISKCPDMWDQFHFHFHDFFYDMWRHDSRQWRCKVSHSFSWKITIMDIFGSYEINRLNLNLNMNLSEK